MGGISFGGSIITFGFFLLHFLVFFVLTRLDLSCLLVLNAFFCRSFSHRLVRGCIVTATATPGTNVIARTHARSK